MNMKNKRIKLTDLIKENQVELGKVYSNPYARAFKPQVPLEEIKVITNFIKIPLSTLQEVQQMYNILEMMNSQFTIQGDSNIAYTFELMMRDKNCINGINAQSKLACLLEWSGWINDNFKPTYKEDIIFRYDNKYQLSKSNIPESSGILAKYNSPLFHDLIKCGLAETNMEEVFNL